MCVVVYMLIKFAVVVGALALSTRYDRSCISWTIRSLSSILAQLLLALS